jgi:tetratricopeptide (TPR) repeat protein
MDLFRNDRRWVFWPYFFIAFLVAIAYLPTLSGEFLLDDYGLIRDNPYTKEAHSVFSYLTQEDGALDRGRYHTGYYRPLINLSYWIDYKLWGMNARGFRTTSLILHILCSLSLYHLLVWSLNDRRAAFFGAILFALHPVNTESVAFISARNNILATMLAILSFHFYIRSWKGSNTLNYVASLIAFTMAILSKEFGLMVLPLIFLYQRTVSQEKESLLKELASYLPFIIILAFYFLLRKGATGTLLTPSEMGNLWSRVYFSPYLILLKLKLIFLPYSLHSFMLSYPSSFVSWKALASILFGCFMGFVLWKKKDHKILVFSAFAFLVTVFPVLNIIPTESRSLIAMRWLYFPMAFILIGVTFWIKRALVKREFLVLSALAMAIFYCGIYTYTLNKNFWQNEYLFFRQEVLHFKNYSYAGSLAQSYLRENDYQKAEKYFQIGIKSLPNFVYNYLNYSDLLIETGRMEVAISYLNKARSLFMRHRELGHWNNNMGMAQFRLGNWEKAIGYLKKAVIFFPDEAQFWANLGGAYGTTGEYEKSILALKKGLEVVPNSIRLRKNLALTYIKMKDYNKALITLEKISLPDRERNPDIKILLRRARDGLLKRDYSFRVGGAC